MVEHQEEAPEFIVEVRTFESSQGRRISERVVRHGTAPDDYARFVGFTKVQVALPGFPPREHAIQFPIREARSVVDAYAHFAAEAKEAAERLEHEVNRRREPQVQIASPGDVPPEP